MITKEMKPKISVIMPAYNAEKYIGEAVESVLNQTYENLELLIIDDCSTDGTFQLLECIAKKDSRIKIFRNEKNLGVADTRNRGFEIADGEYSALIDSDDVWRREKLEKQIELMIRQGIDVSYCSYGLIDENGNKCGRDFITPAKTEFDQMLEKSVISCSTAVLSKNIVKNYKFKKEYYHEDLVFWLQILKDGFKARGVIEVLADYRILANSRSSNKLVCAIERWNVYRDYFEIPRWKSLCVWIKYVFHACMKYTYKTSVFAGTK